MRAAALSAIGIYQRYVSPHKGFCCAYRVHTGKAGCSALGARAIRRWGVLRGLGVLKLRLGACGEVHRRCLQTPAPRPLALQRGECDVVPDFGCCDVADCCDCGDCGSRRKRTRRADKRRRGA